MSGLTFETALFELKAGKKLARIGWNGKGMHVEMQKPDEQSKMTKPYLFIHPGSGWVVPWVPGQWDMFTDDWYVVQEAP